jgi:hypothetical protein
MSDAAKSPTFTVTPSDDGKHLWVGLLGSGPYAIGFHADHAGTWVELRGPNNKQLPEVAVCVQKSTGRPVLQVCVPGEEPVTVDLVRAVTFLNRILADEAK